MPAFQILTRICGVYSHQDSPFREGGPEEFLPELIMKCAHKLTTSDKQTKEFRTALDKLTGYAETFREWEEEYGNRGDPTTLDDVLKKLGAK